MRRVGVIGLGLLVLRRTLVVRVTAGAFLVFEAVRSSDGLDVEIVEVEALGRKLNRNG